MLVCMGNYGVFYGLRGEFGPQGGVLNLGAGIWALALAFRFWSCYLGLKAAMWDLRLEFSPKAGIWAWRLGFGP